MGDVSRILGMNVTRDREKGAITISQKDYTKNVVQRYGMEGCNPAYTPGVGPELSLDHMEEKPLNEDEKRRRQGIIGVVHEFRPSHTLRHPLRGQPAGEGHILARQTHMGATYHLLRYLVGSTYFSITYKQGGLGLLPSRVPTRATIPTRQGLRHHIS